jgi:hypothetical protein
MTKEQADAKLALLPLTAAVSTYYDFIDEVPYLTFEYALSGGGAGSVSIPMSPSDTNLNDLVNNLPMLAADRLASLAIMLTPAQPTQPA